MAIRVELTSLGKVEQLALAAAAGDLRLRDDEAQALADVIEELKFLRNVVELSEAVITNLSRQMSIWSPEVQERLKAWRALRGSERIAPIACPENGWQW